MRYFGTDGIRCIIGEPKLNPQIVLNLGYAVGRVLTEMKRGPIIIGKDTRISGYFIESALEAGLSAAGAEIILTGPLPSPAIALLVSRHDAAGAFVISASHNQFEYNGIKIFNAHGEKLSPDHEKKIETILDETQEAGITCMPSHRLGKAMRLTTAAGQYIRYLNSCISYSFNLEKLKIVFDGAHGACYAIGPSLFRQLGADVIPIGCNPNGLNINKECGSLYPEILKKAVEANNADIGISVDGDGDRIIAYCKGHFIDGDMILYLIAKYRKLLSKPITGIIGTELSNGGLPASLKKHGVSFDRSAVGDKYVYELLCKHEWFIGGEPSGHIIFREHSNTGDGLLASLKLLEVIQGIDCSFKDFIADYETFPNKSVNIPFTSREKMDTVVESEKMRGYITQSNKQKNQRVIVRLSGTEDLLRIYAESEKKETVQKIIEDITAMVQA